VLDYGIWKNKTKQTNSQTKQNNQTGYLKGWMMCAALAHELRIKQIKELTSGISKAVQPRSRV